MCDTLALRSTGATWLAKNSDRDPLEAQRVEFIPAVKGDSTRQLRCTWIEIPQVPDRHACIIGRPAWMWGAEMGVNECGVAIGNEAVFSRKVKRRGAALLGMDLLRLALERADSADAALQVIVELLRQYGQGGPAGYTHKEFRYDNSFLIADRATIWKLETAGAQWVAKKVASVDSISNALTIGDDYQLSTAELAAKPVDFRRQFDTWLVPLVGASRMRRECSLNQLRALDADTAGFADFARILRTHRRGKPSGNSDLCMHAAPSRSPFAFLRPSHTVNSMIVRIDDGGPRVAFTGTASPCMSLFRPAGFSPDWSVYQRDLWEKHRVWLDNVRRGSRGRFQASVANLEMEMFGALETLDPEAAEKPVTDRVEAVFRDAVGDCQPGVKAGSLNF
ncbi:carcinine hydrolase/isopenicillin-N N-acyltransferase family protein [Microbulbifer hydrolyticus]|uniref:Dipeptidase n=1 Tax=Microbulbifer hydrolyticus TaxID=48074 RepID=A0A6P1TAB6_9GAMM|nr:carcinine hydrolase/isopenicillin-N N-acyltransferase family protein [Microbulbifer hydrolyticus]MBB5210878.1 hypothetical protein [Microbulbifer hydrolyticus]QHQ38695.1 peptidase family C69 [Microbulbifer hydrolyticus]